MELELTGSARWIARLLFLLAGLGFFVEKANEYDQHALFFENPRN
jgi:hypothetical protein